MFFVYVCKTPPLQDERYMLGHLFPTHFTHLIVERTPSKAPKWSNQGLPRTEPGIAFVLILQTYLAAQSDINPGRI